MKLFINFSYYQTTNLHVQLIYNNTVVSPTRFGSRPQSCGSNANILNLIKPVACIIIKYAIVIITLNFFPLRCDPVTSHDLPWRGFVVTLRHTTLDRATLDEWSARHRDLYLTTSNTHKRQIPMPPAGFEPTIPASERPQTHALDRAATGISNYLCLLSHKIHELTACEITVLYINTAVSCAQLTFTAQPKHVVEGTVLLYILYCKLLALLIRNIWCRTECATIKYLQVLKDCNISRYITWQNFIFCWPCIST